MGDESSLVRRPIITRDTLVPWGAAVAFASLTWFGATKYGDLEKQIIANATDLAERAADQSKDVALQIQALKFTVEAQGRDLAEVKKSVEALSRAQADSK